MQSKFDEYYRLYRLIIDWHIIFLAFSREERERERKLSLPATVGKY